METAPDAAPLLNAQIQDDGEFIKHLLRSIPVVCLKLSHTGAEAQTLRRTRR